MFGNIGNSFVFFIVLLIIAGAVVLASGISPNLPITSLSNQALAPTLIAQATTNGELYTLKDKTSLNSNNGQLQLGQPQIVQEACGQNALVIFLLDTSASMSDNNKASSLKAGLNSFASVFPANGILGLTEFSTKVAQIIPPSTYNVVKSNFLNAISSYNPNGDTSTADAFTFIQNEVIANEISKIPGKRKISLIFISDGIPESQAYTEKCLLPPNYLNINTNIPECVANCHYDSSLTQNRCFDPTQDPTNIAQTIKSEGIKIYAIAYPDSNGWFVTKQAGMMSAVASSDSSAPNGIDYWQAPSSNDITSIMSTISDKICN